MACSLSRILNVSDALGIVLDTVPELVCRELYDRIGEPRPI